MAQSKKYDCWLAQAKPDWSAGIPGQASSNKTIALSIKGNRGLICDQ